MYIYTYIYIYVERASGEILGAAIRWRLFPGNDISIRTSVGRKRATRVFTGRPVRGIDRSINFRTVHIERHVNTIGYGRSNSFVLISVPLIDYAPGRVKVIRATRRDGLRGNENRAIRPPAPLTQRNTPNIPVRE